MRRHVNANRPGTGGAKTAASPSRRRGVFPERQIFFRTEGRVRFLTLTSSAQWALMVVAFGFAGWLGHTIYTLSQFERVLADREQEIENIHLSYSGLRSAISESESRFRTMTRTLEAKHAYLMALLDRQTASPGPLKASPVGPSKSDPVRQRIENSRRALLAQLGALEQVLAKASPKSPAGLETTRPGEPFPTGLDHAQLKRERKRLVARIEKLERRLREINGGQRRVMNYFAARSIDDFDRAKKLVALSGLDVDRLLSEIGSQVGRGGPFIAATPGLPEAKPARIPAALGIIDHQLDRWEKLSMLIGRLPLIAPSDHYYLASGFGKRRDPINGRWAMHYGVDLAGVNRSPVLATAPGVVVKAKWVANYGRFVEIDHGLGIRTRYGHLRRIVVRRGQKVGFRQKIGQMGSSGRSTGTHVHYEILVNGEPRDPEKFMQAGEHVLKGF